MNGFSGYMDNGTRYTPVNLILVIFWIPDVWIMSCNLVWLLPIIYYGCKNELLGGGPCSPSAFLLVSLTLFVYVCIYNISRHQTDGKSRRPDCYCGQSPHRHQAGSHRPWWGMCAGGVWVESFNPTFTCSTRVYDGFPSSPQSLSIHLTSTKGPIDVLLCPDDDSDPKSPVKNGGTDINGNSPFLKVLQGLLQTFMLLFLELNTNLTNQPPRMFRIRTFLNAKSRRSFDCSWQICDLWILLLSPDPSSVSAAPSPGPPPAPPAAAVSVTTLSPILSPYTSLLQQTEDQIPTSLGPFLNLGPPLLEQDDYLLGLGDDQGISDLFDACDFDKIRSLGLDDLLCS